MPTPAPAARRDPLGWIRPYLERAPLAALLLGISSGFPYAMIGATLTTRLAQDGIDKKSVTAFALAFLVYNIKFLWAPLVDRFHLPLLRSEEHTSELQSLMRTSYAVFCLKKKKNVMTYKQISHNVSSILLTHHSIFKF